jgi:hypothetical protein
MAARGIPSRDKAHALDYARKILRVSPDLAATFAYERLQAHLLGARTQMRRLTEAFHGDVAEADRPTLVQAELHFYLVAWSACGNMLAAITSPPDFNAARGIYDRHKHTFAHYKEARHTFEHFDDRLPGRPNNKRVRPTVGADGRVSSIIYGVDRDTYRHSNLSWDISPASLALLENIVAEVLDAVHAVVDQRLTALHPRR